MLEYVKNKLFKYAPLGFLKFGQRINKNIRRLNNLIQYKQERGFTQNDLTTDLITLGVKKGDSILVHCSFSSIGYVRNGPQTFINSLFQAVTDTGTILFPSFPAAHSNKHYLDTNPVFDLLNTPSQVGLVTEYFRTLPNVSRSFHPTDSVCAKGALAEYYTNTHYGQITPYNEYSPFRKLCIKKGKVLMIGTNACTLLHTLEDAVPDFKYKAYCDEMFDAKMIDHNGVVSYMKTKVHNPQYTSKRNFNELKPFLQKEGILVEGKMGNTYAYLIDADKLHTFILKQYYQNGFIPFGDKNNKSLKRKFS